MVRDALAAKIKTLAEVLRASPTWDQGPEMGKWNRSAWTLTSTSSSATRTRHGSAPRIRTRGLLRQYFPKSTDLSAHSADDLDWVAAELNERPRKRLGFKKPIEQIGPLLLR